MSIMVTIGIIHHVLSPIMNREIIEDEGITLTVDLHGHHNLSLCIAVPETRDLVITFY